MAESLTNHFQQPRLANIIDLNLKKTSTQVVETTVTNNSFFQSYP